MSEKVLDGS